MAENEVPEETDPAASMPPEAESVINPEAAATPQPLNQEPPADNPVGQPPNVEPDEAPATETPAPADEPVPAGTTDPVPNPSNWEANAQAARQADKQAPEKFARLKAFFHAYWARKKWTLPVTVLVLLIILLGVPFTRYKTLGLFLKHDLTVSVVDNTTGNPVTRATIANGKQKIDTDANGKAKLHLSVGPHKLMISKKYYTSKDATVSVKLFGQQSPAAVKVVATGRQVPVSVTNTITGKPLADVDIDVQEAKAKTDKQGKAIVVLPTKVATQKATLELDGYNKSSVTIQITDQAVKANDFKLTPAGKLYFLSNLSGKIDVVKTNLDGSDRHTVLAGTGSEDGNNTALLASRDWKYLALLSKRNGQQGIYLIDTADDTVTNIDGGSATASFTLVGWSDDTFVYQVSRSNIQNWQSGAQAIKGYDATAGKLYSLDQTQGEGTSQNDYAFTSFGTVSILGSELVYTRSWYASGTHSLDGKSDNLISVKANGASKHSIKDFPVAAGTSYGYTIDSILYEPLGLYVRVPNSSNNGNTYYEYEDGKLTQKSDVTDDSYNKPYPTFLISPSGNQTFWSEVRDNKNTLFIGNASGANAKQIASLSEDTPYGWYSDNYLLVSAGGSELYVLPVSGSKFPIKITDYYKPQLSFRGYGGGYGGL